MMEALHAQLPLIDSENENVLDVEFQLCHMKNGVKCRERTSTQNSSGPVRRPH